MSHLIEGNFSGAYTHFTPKPNDSEMFKYEYNMYLYLTVDNAYKSIMSSPKKQEYIDFFIKGCPKETGYMFYNHPLNYKIGMLFIDNEGNNPHSGASIGVSMRHLEDIFNNGWSTYLEHTYSYELD